ncbi:MAG: AraC family transcriptional regulator [Lentisphaeria bacterium]
MTNNTISDFYEIAKKLPEPQNLFNGKFLPEHFALPDNILIFYHNWLEASPNAHGRYTLVIPFSNMTYYVDDNRISVHPGEVLLIHPHQMRYLHPDSKGFGRLFVTFDLPEPATYLPSSALNQINADSREQLQKFIYHYQKDHIFKAAITLIYFFLALQKSTPVLQKSKISQNIADAIAYIHNHLDKPVNNAKIASKLHLSVSNLRQQFRKEIGISLGQYITKQRFNAANHRLLYTSMNIEEISLSCGYKNIAVFSHAFKKNTGLSPMNFRKKNT